MNSFRRLYHTSLGFLVAPAFGLGLPIGQHSWRRMITLLEAARKPAQFGSCCICILGNCSPLAAWQASPGNTYVRGYSWDGRTCRAGDDYFSWLGRGPLGANSSDLMRGIVLDLWRNMPCVLCTTGRRIFRGYSICGGTCLAFFAQPGGGYFEEIIHDFCATPVSRVAAGYRTKLVLFFSVANHLQEKKIDSTSSFVVFCILVGGDVGRFPPF